MKGENAQSSFDREKGLFLRSMVRFDGLYCCLRAKLKNEATKCEKMQLG